MGLSDGAGRCGKCLPRGVGLVGFFCHEEAVVGAVEVALYVCGSVLWGPEPLVIRR